MDNWPLPEREQRRIVRFCADITRTLLLGHYSVGLSEDPAPDDALASIEVTDGRHAATVKVTAGWMGLSDEVKVNSLIHETLHITHERLNRVIYDTLYESHYMPDAAYRMLCEQIRRECEFMVDHWAGAISEFTKPHERWAELGKVPLKQLRRGQS